MFLSVVTRLFHCPVIIKAGWVPYSFAGLLWELHEHHVIYIALYFGEVVYSTCLMSYSSTLEAI